VTFGSKPISAPPFRPRPSTRTENAFAVGSRVLLTATAENTKTLTLLDEDGMQTSLQLPVDALVVITAWKPRRSAPARYRVCSSDRVEGWIDAANLRRLPPPPPPPTPPAPVVPAKVAKPAAKPAAAAKATAKPGPVKPGAAKPALKPSGGVRPAEPVRKSPVAAARPQAAAKAKVAPRAAKPAPRPSKPRPAKKASRPTRKRAR
jgi:hypothetical protein